MKERTNPLKSSWRNFNSPSSKTENSLHNAPMLNNSIENTLSNDKSLFQANNLGGNTPPGLSKPIVNSQKLLEKFKNTFNINENSINELYEIDRCSSDDIKKLEAKYGYSNVRKLTEFARALDMSRINLYPAPSGNLNLKELKNRRLSVELSRIISKLAEDHYGAITEGDEFWDCNRLAMRKINKESIIKCRNSKEKHNIIIMLDSSPSCSKQAEFYSKIASESCKFGDIELYDAPNARLVHRYSHKEKAFVRFLTPEDIINDVSSWNFFKNRTIIFFGDFDGISILTKASLTNKIYWFHPSNDEYHDLDYYNYNKTNFTLFENINGINEFMKACKKLK